jgi:hypothetical protein
MKTTFTCGVENRRVSFEYELLAAPTVRWTYEAGEEVTIKGSFLDAIRNEFKGKTLLGGFSEDSPTPNGLGIWVRDNANNMNGCALTPRHASRIAAIMRDLGWLESANQDNAVVIRFFE